MSVYQVHVHSYAGTRWDHLNVNVIVDMYKTGVTAPYVEVSAKITGIQNNI